MIFLQSFMHQKLELHSIQLLGWQVLEGKAKTLQHDSLLEEFELVSKLDFCFSEASLSISEQHQCKNLISLCRIYIIKGNICFYLLHPRVQSTIPQILLFYELHIILSSQKVLLPFWNRNLPLDKMDTIFNAFERNRLYSSCTGN